MGAAGPAQPSPEDIPAGRDALHAAIRSRPNLKPVKPEDRNDRSDAAKPAPGAKAPGGGGATTLLDAIRNVFAAKETGGRPVDPKPHAVARQDSVSEDEEGSGASEDDWAEDAASYAPPQHPVAPVAVIPPPPPTSPTRKAPDVKTEPKPDAPVASPDMAATIRDGLDKRRAAFAGEEEAAEERDDRRAREARRSPAPAPEASTEEEVIQRPASLGLGGGSPVATAPVSPVAGTPDFPPPPLHILAPASPATITPETPASVVQMAVTEPVAIIRDANGNAVVRHGDGATHDHNGSVTLKCNDGACIDAWNPGSNVIIRGGADLSGQGNAAPLVIADDGAAIAIDGPVTLAADADNVPVIAASGAAVINLGPTTIFLPAGGLDNNPVITAETGAAITVHGKLALPATHGEIVVRTAGNGSVALANAAGVANAGMRGQIRSTLKEDTPLVEISDAGRVTIQGHDIVADAGDLQDAQKGAVVRFGNGGGRLALDASNLQLENGRDGHALIHIDDAARSASILAIDSTLSAPGDSMLIMAEADAAFAGRRVTLSGDIVADAPNAVPAMDLTLADHSRWKGDLDFYQGAGNLTLADNSFWEGDFRVSGWENTARLATSSSWLGDALLMNGSELSVTLADQSLWRGDTKPGAISVSNVNLATRLSGESVWAGDIDANDAARIRVTLESGSRWLGHMRVTDSADIGVNLHDGKWTGGIEAADNARVQANLLGISAFSGLLNVGDKGLIDVTMNEAASWSGGVIAANDATIAMHISGNGRLAGGVEAGDNARIAMNLADAGDWHGGVWADKGAAIAVRLNDKAVWKGQIVAPEARAVVIALNDRSRWEGQGRATSIGLLSPDARWDLTGNTLVRDQVLNAGVINLAHTPGAILRTETYSGADGRIAMAVNLDDAKNGMGNRLIFTRRAEGRTTLDVATTGMGGLTTGAGLPVVIAANDQAISTDDAFVLAAPVTAGAHVYALRKGADAAAGARVQNSWHLRSTKLITSPAAPGGPANPSAPVNPGAPATPGVPTAPGSGAHAPVGATSASVVIGSSFGPDAIPAQATAQGHELPMYRAETPLYGAVPDLARTLSMLTAGSREDRLGAVRSGNGDRADEEEATSEAWIGAWARALGGSLTEGASLSQTPSLNGAYGGFQAGADLLGYSTGFHEGRFGVFGGHAAANTRIRGFAEGEINMAVGSLAVDATSGGVYWTHTGPGGVYVDATVSGSLYDASGKSVRGGNVNVTGHGVTVTVETGAPLLLGGGFTLEPQAQVIWRMLDLKSQHDDFARINYRTRNTTRVRFGGRLSWSGMIGKLAVKPFIQAGLWRQTGKVDRVIYNGATSIPSAIATRGVDLDAGLELAPNSALSIWASAGGSFDLDRAGGRTNRRSWRGKTGLRYQW
ncbi:autotransporter outer membrane beta-barrel domain-containing protein [Camelimonas sp. ID_303_24]